MHRANLETLAPTLETLRRGLREQCRLTIQYQAISSQAEQREIAPYALVHRWGWWCFIAYCHLRQVWPVITEPKTESRRRAVAILTTPCGIPLPL